MQYAIFIFLRLQKIEHQPRRNVSGNCTARPFDPIAIGFKFPHIFFKKNLRNRIVAHIFATD